jgi:hypothetical protein
MQVNILPPAELLGYRQRLVSDAGAELVLTTDGAMDLDLATSAMLLTERFIKSKGDPTPLRKRCIGVLVECAENLAKHVKEEHRSSCSLVLVRRVSGYVLLVGNAMPWATAVSLAQRVEILNDMTGSDLRMGHLKLLGSEARSDHGGAGLGLMAIARKSDRPIIVRTYPLDQHTAYFQMECRIGTEH